MSITVNVKNDCLPVWLSDSAVYVPKLYQFDNRISDPPVELVDVVEMWRGLQPEHARELRFWQGALKSGIEDLVEEALHGSYERAGFQLDDMSMERLDEMHNFTQALGHRRLKCNLDKLIDHMELCHELSGRPCHNWFSWNRSHALANFIQLHHCFPQDDQALHVFFSCDQRHPMELQVFAEIFSNPHTFRLRGDMPWFQAPVLDNRKYAYPVDISPASQDALGSWQMTVTTRFPDGVRFERRYRFRHQSVAEPIPLSIPVQQTRKQRKSKRKTQSKFGVPCANPLRTLSNGDVRVQGNTAQAPAITDLELEARDTHPEFYETHLDQNIRKSSILGKIYGTLAPQENQSVNMMHATLSPTHLRDSNAGSEKCESSSSSPDFSNSSPSPRRVSGSIRHTAGKASSRTSYLFTSPNRDLMDWDSDESASPILIGKWPGFSPSQRLDITLQESATSRPDSKIAWSSMKLSKWALENPDKKGKRKAFVDEKPDNKWKRKALIDEKPENKWKRKVLIDENPDNKGKRKAFIDEKPDNKGKRKMLTNDKPVRKGKRKILTDEESIDEETLEQVRKIDEAVFKREEKEFEKIFLGSPASISTVEISSPESVLDLEDNINSGDSKVAPEKDSEVIGWDDSRSNDPTDCW